MTSDTSPRSTRAITAAASDERASRGVELDASERAVLARALERAAAKRQTSGRRESLP
jgi:hypothetical protein